MTAEPEYSSEQRVIFDLAAKNGELRAEVERLRAERDDERDLHYLRSILDQLHELRSFINYGPTLGGEVLADNIDWLDCFIDKRERALEHKS